MYLTWSTWSASRWAPHLPSFFARSGSRITASCRPYRGPVGSVVSSHEAPREGILREGNRHEGDAFEISTRSIDGERDMLHRRAQLELGTGASAEQFFSVLGDKPSTWVLPESRETAANGYWAVSWKVFWRKLEEKSEVFHNFRSLADGRSGAGRSFVGCPSSVGWVPPSESLPSKSGIVGRLSSCKVVKVTESLTGMTENDPQHCGGHCGGLWYMRQCYLLIGSIRQIGSGGI